MVKQTLAPRGVQDKCFHCASFGACHARTRFEDGFEGKRGLVYIRVPAGALDGARFAFGRARAGPCTRVAQRGGVQSSVCSGQFVRAPRDCTRPPNPLPRPSLRSRARNAAVFPGRFRAAIRFISTCLVLGAGIGASSFFGASAQPINGCVVAIAVECPSADLRKADLRGRLAARANFAGADLRYARLDGIVLWKTNFAGANLEGAKLNDAFLTGADLRGANLTGADLSGAFLFRAFTEGAKFEGARLDGARWITGEVCAPGSVGACHPLPATAAIPVPVPAAASNSQPVEEVAAKGSQAVAAPRPPPATPTGSLQLVNDSHGVVTRILPADPAKAQPTDGASFLGSPFIVRDGTSILNIQVTAEVFAEKPTEAVLAVFRDGKAPPIKLVRKEIAAQKTVRMEFAFDVPAGGAQAVHLDFRVGPARAGAITLNGPASANAATPTATRIAIKETR